MMSKEAKNKIVKKKRKPYSVSRKGIGGARSKLSESLVVLCWEMIQEWHPLEVRGSRKTEKKSIYEQAEENNAKIVEYTRLNSLDGVAYYLGISRVTIWHYLNDKQDVYDRKLKIEFFNAVKMWETKRNALHDQMLLYFAPFPSLWIYLHKNFHGIHDVDERAMIKVINLYVDNSTDSSQTNIQKNVYGEITDEEISKFGDGEEARNVAEEIYKEILRRRARNPAPKSPLDIIQG